MQSGQVYHIDSILASLAVLLLECPQAPLVLLGYDKTAGTTSDDIVEVVHDNHISVLPQLAQPVQQHW